MSFSFEFSANLADAPAIVAKAYAPDSIKQFVYDALNGLANANIAVVNVKAMGHLKQSNADYAVSTANIEVKPIYLTAAPVANSNQ